MSSEQKPLSWWKRHCTPPPAINRTPQCPCSACWNGNGEHWKTTAPQTTAPSYTSTPSPPTKETRAQTLRREIESDLTPLHREETSSTTNLSVYSQESSTSSDRASLTNVHRPARGKEIF
ncbi:hypothetical protein CORC01_05477 [Colletotrichum orchidophilum]|uniref:Uncharacterized protein n=1 Tax=Colletotrichum orchidophilum TaxID=1209926 RepID=A0A1G4BCW5_9PEZI|nr:uncharacterized protein CORC01_05477 [Colletotrichum orchidophilum]OHE99196.1 hypothetical protein CORC01_05477 [Colletotrichum orchidophilum]